MTTLQTLHHWAVERGLHLQDIDAAAFTRNITEELDELREAVRHSDINGIVDAIADILVFCTSELSKVTEDIDGVLLETHKEISTRRGAWEESLGKWMKDTSHEAVSLWYTADYLPYLKGDKDE